MSDVCDQLAQDLPLPPGVPGGMESYRRTKARIFGGAERPSAVCVVPAVLLEDVRGDVSGERNWLTFGVGAADFRYEDGRVFNFYPPNCRVAVWLAKTLH